jgi:formylglycine-generating enzyme required for sulfatase activity
MKLTPVPLFLCVLVPLGLIATQGQVYATASSTPVPTPAFSATPTPAPTTAPQTWVRHTDGSVMVAVAAGVFLMGSTEPQVETAFKACQDEGTSCSRDWYTDEMPLHRVRLDAFWIDQTEVTNAQYRECVEEGECKPPTVCDTGEPTYDESSKADHPVVCVSWNMAQSYCSWAGARLPTESEWEKAARGTDGSVCPWGNDFDGRWLNYCDRVCEYASADAGIADGYAHTAPVGSYPAGASPYGALDMAGNVWEWVADWYAADYYGQSPISNPTGPNKGVFRMIRGGSWGSSWYATRTSQRLEDYPDDRRSYSGFRCVVSTAATP